VVSVVGGVVVGAVVVKVSATVGVKISAPLEIVAVVPVPIRASIVPLVRALFGSKTRPLPSATFVALSSTTLCNAPSANSVGPSLRVALIVAPFTLFINCFTRAASPIAAVNKVTRPDPAAAAAAAELAFSTETPLLRSWLYTSS
jgi:hypothetical protein